MRARKTRRDWKRGGNGRQESNRDTQNGVRTKLIKAADRKTQHRKASAKQEKHSPRGRGYRNGPVWKLRTGNKDALTCVAGVVDLDGIVAVERVVGACALQTLLVRLRRSRER